MESPETSESVAVYMPLGAEGSDAYRLVFAEHLGGQAYRLLETQPEGEQWRIPGATTVFAVEGERPGMLVAVAPYVAAEAGQESATPAKRRDLSAAGLRRALTICFAGAAASILIGWCFFRAPAPMHPADPLRLGVLVTGAVVLWWAGTLETVRFSRGVVALMSIPTLLFSAALIVEAIFW